jgi:hypothetical protein
MSKTAKRVHVRQEFLFLNRLRESGETNMFGAAPYLEDEFGLERRDARTVLTEWMQWTGEDAGNINL